MNLNNLNDKSAQVLLLVFITVLLFGSLTPGSRSASTTQSALVSTSALTLNSIPPVKTLSGSTSTAASSTLQIPPVYQKTPVWCWLAVGEMVHKYFGLPTLNPSGDYQCGLVATLAGPNSACWGNCGNCVGAAGNYGPVNAVVADMIRRYPEMLRSLNRYDGPTLTVQWRYSALNNQEIVNEIDARRPVILGISPSGYPQNVQSEHVALLIGYEATNAGMNVIVNDPFPFDRVPFNQHPNPYLAQGGQSLGGGRYSIEVQRLRQGLVWRETFFSIGPGATPPQVSNLFRCNFAREPSVNYFVRTDNQIVVVFPNGGQRVVGRRIAPTVSGFSWMYSTPVITYGVDRQGAVWSRGPMGQPFQVGYCGS
jgi:hypothetical protein